MPDRAGHDRLIITIDGPAGTGKSTVAQRLARRLGLELLDTGAMYRAAALVTVERSIDPNDGEAIADAVRRSGLRFDWNADPPAVMLGDRDVSRRIRDLDVSRVVSVVAAQTPVREVLVARQRQLAGEHPRLVSEGRDQGSVVFPDAVLRFYLDADMTERVRRRVAQIAAGGEPVDEGTVRDDIRKRDRIDTNRSDAPLIRPEGAIVVDSSHRSVDEVVDLLESMVRRALPDARLGE
jgi:cytidylate kinase